MSINVWTGEGRICEQPEIRIEKNKNGEEKKVLYFTLAMNKGRNLVNYQDCKAYEGIAETIAQYFSKGDQIMVTGESDNYSVIDRGERRKRQIMVINNFSFGAKKKKESEERNEKKKDDFSDYMDADFEELKFY